MKHNLHEIRRARPQDRKAVLVGVQMLRDQDIPLDVSLEELKGLAKTAHYEAVAVITQKTRGINPKTFLGKGKVEAVAEAARAHAAEVVIFDESLSPTQNRNLEDALGLHVIDRPWLIIEIFNDHARTREAKTQVELARLKYELPRLTKMWAHLSRQRGGIGMREVGETQLQLDRRLIRDKIHALEAALKLIEKEKTTQKKSRRDEYKVALVGYTNVGKSTLMNQLTGADTLVEDKLFATLDATIRRIRKNFPYPVLVADTVGLIEKLPHDLIASFKSTLDEVREADLLLKVTDLSHPNFQIQMETTEQLLRELGAGEMPSLLVFNKVDKLTGEQLTYWQTLYPDAVFISGLNGAGMDELRRKITAHYESRLEARTVKLSYQQGGLLEPIRKLALIIDAKYAESGITLQLRVPPRAQSSLNALLRHKKAARRK